MSWPTSSETLVPLIVLGAGAAAAVIDLHTRRVPNTLTGGVAAAGVLLAASGYGPIGVGAAIAGGAVGLSLMLPGHLLGATGGGDVKLLAAMGTLLGPAGAFTAFVFSAIAGGATALVVALYRGRFRQTLGSTARLAAGTRPAADLDAQNTFAYAPAIAIGAALAVIGV
jgi:prepilin peptidase CpaA